MPLTKTGKKVMRSMRKKYGKRAKEVFYASINKGVAGSSKWHNSPLTAVSKGLDLSNPKILR